AGDLNADGRDDFIIGAPLASPDGRARAGSVYLFSGMDGGLLRRVDGPAAGDLLGLSMAGMGDVNGDGTADLAAGAPFADRDGKSDAGSVLVFSGLDGALLFEKNGTFPFDYLGWSVDGVGDVNADGKSDFIGGAPFSNPDGHFDGGLVLVFSGADGSLLFQKSGTQGLEELGWSLAGLGDLNGDGGSDFIIGAPGSNRASIYVACSAGKGDFNADGGFSPADVVLSLFCVFPGRENCAGCFSDLNCDGLLTIADVVGELNAVFLQIPPPC
ncbi:MAG: integrin alpha, partial [Limisphaerales bacterium]